MPWPFPRAKEEVTFVASAAETLRLLQGLGAASTTKGVESLTRLTKSPVQVQDPGVALVPARSLAAVLSGVASAQTLAHMPVGDGFGVLALPRDASLRLVDLLLGQPTGTTREMDALAESAIAETANIALNAMATSVAQQAGAPLRTGVPQTSFSPATKVPELARPPAGKDHAIVVETLFAEPTSGVSGRMALILFTGVER